MRFIKPYYKTNFNRKLDVTPITPYGVLYPNEYIIEIFVKNMREVSPTFKKLKRAFFFDVNFVKLSYCPNIEKIYCNKTNMLEIGPYRPEVMGEVSDLIFEGQFVQFNNLVKNNIEIIK